MAGLLRAVMVAVVLAACGPSQPDGSTGTTFIALQRDFADFEGWEAWSWTGDGLTNTHQAGAVTVYLNHRPPAGSAFFPVGTIIVKVTPPSATASEEQIFAMAKRGGSFNANGAAGWEWFELARGTSGTPVIVWRGVGAPAGHRYSEVNSSCNDCHAGAASNDSVRSPPLQLGEL